VTPSGVGSELIEAITTAPRATWKVLEVTGTVRPSAIEPARYSARHPNGSLPELFGTISSTITNAASKGMAVAAACT
jgi:hypothetical protein